MLNKNIHSRCLSQQTAQSRRISALHSSEWKVWKSSGKKVKQQPSTTKLCIASLIAKAPLLPNTCLWKWFWMRLWRWSVLLQHKHWTHTCLPGCAMKWKMGIKNSSVQKWASYHEGTCWFISLSSLSNRHIFCSDFHLECACCFADELWLSRMAYLGELFTSPLCWMPVYKKRLKTILLRSWQNRQTKKKVSKAALITGEGEKINCQSLSS